MDSQARISLCESVFYMRMQTLRPMLGAVKNSAVEVGRHVPRKRSRFPVLCLPYTATAAAALQRWARRGVSVKSCLDQKSNWALIFAKRADSTEVGVIQAPFGMNAWL